MPKQLRRPKTTVIPKTAKNKKAYKVIDPWDRALTDMSQFWRNTNWAQWWEEFYLTPDEHGQWLWSTLRQFIEHKAESREQRDFMYWYLGPGDEKDPRYKFIPEPGIPLNWFEKRKTGGWRMDSNLNEIEKLIGRQYNAIDALRTVGNKLTAAQILRMERLSRQVDEATRGQLFLPNAPTKFNVERALSLINIYREIQELTDKAVSTFAKCHGINFEDVSGLVHLMESSLLPGESNGKIVETTEQKALASVVKMALQKAAVYGYPIPDDATQAIIDVAKEDESKPSNKKVQ